MKKPIIICYLVVLFSIYLAAQQSTLQASKKKGEDVYKKYCLSCHQADGGGVPKMNPPLIGTSYVTGDKQKLIAWVLKGSSERVEINGKYYSNNMAPQAALTDQQIANVLTYVRNSFGNQASQVMPAEVKMVRAGIK